MANRNASAVLFGWDFQINAAIVLMLENIKIANKIKIEGKSQDIEITLNSGKKVYAQAKSVVKSSSDFRNVKANLKNAMNSLSESYAEKDAERLIFVTNSPNPFNNKDSKNIFYGRAIRKYDTLPESCKKIIDDNITELQIGDCFDKELFEIRVIPFETEDLKEKYKVIKEEVNEFLYSLGVREGMGQKVLDIWQKVLFENGTISDENKTLTKSDMIWPLIVLSTPVEQCTSEFIDMIDECDYDEFVQKYKAFIDNRVERFDFVTQIITDYKNYYHIGNNKDKTMSFIKEKWKDYIDDFEDTCLEEDVKENLIKIIIYNILKQKRRISSIKEKVGI